MGYKLEAIYRTSLMIFAAKCEERQRNVNQHENETWKMLYGVGGCGGGASKPHVPLFG